MDKATAERVFARAEQIRFFHHRQAQIASADYWRSLNPGLTITNRPLTAMLPRFNLDSVAPERCLDSLLHDGYFQISPVVPANMLERLSTGIDRVVSAGFPPDFACVYDEFYQVFTSVSPVLTKLLGGGYLMVPEGISTFHFNADSSMSRSAPHRDSLGPDTAVARGQTPTLINIWIAITDATPHNSCMYVLPATHDPQFRQTQFRKPSAAELDLQAIRALPSAAGSVLGWSSHLLHWGSRPAQWSSQPRMSVALYFQSADAALYHHTALPPDAEFGLHDRLAWIADSLADFELFSFPPTDSTLADSR